jgi:hypothetical protein
MDTIITMGLTLIAMALTAAMAICILFLWFVTCEVIRDLTYFIKHRKK